MEAADLSETVPGHDFFGRARDRLTLRVPSPLSEAEQTRLRGDHDADPAIRAIAEAGPIRPAAVLIPVVDHPQPTVLLTLRASALSTHAGQIAFPGGRIDPGDKTPLAAALREADEEIGLKARFVEPLGYLDPYLTGTGFRITPAVARVSPGIALRLNPDEVDDAFEVPLAFVMGPENHQRHSREWRGMMRSYYAMPFGERYIWGVTAGILRNLYERIYCEPAPARAAGPKVP